MFFVKIFKKIDTWLCAYLGLKSDTPPPGSIKLERNNAMVMCTVPYKRHLLKFHWEEYAQTLAQNQPSPILGAEPIASKLAISFNEPKIRMYQDEER